MGTASAVVAVINADAAASNDYGKETREAEGHLNRGVPSAHEPIIHPSLPQDGFHQS